jgi:TrmH family RNA methyltransferase
MPSLSEEKLIRKLQQRKYRWREQLFIAEGIKVVGDLLAAGLRPHKLWLQEDLDLDWPIAFEPVKAAWIKEYSSLNTSEGVLALFPIPEIGAELQSGWTLVLDQVNDPGNLGTLIRSADWCGFSQLICVKGTADIYNPKTVQATMGSLGRVSVRYLSLEAVKDFLADSDQEVLVADMQGEDLMDYVKSQDRKPKVLILGSESHGPNASWLELGKPITISKIGDSAIDSLNVAIAGAICMQALRAGS